jgi:hypothetical protein
MKYLLLFVLSIGLLASCSDDLELEATEQVQINSFSENFQVTDFPSTRIIDKDGNPVNSLSVTSNPYLDSEAKNHIVNELRLSENECTGQLVIVIITELPDGNYEHWSFGLNEVQTMNSCIKYHFNSGVNISDADLLETK